MTSVDSNIAGHADVDVSDGEGGKKPKCAGLYSPKFRDFICDYPDFRSFQLLPEPPGFRGLPRTIGYHILIYRRGEQNNICGWGARQPRFRAKYLLKTEAPSAFHPNSCLRQLQWVSVGEENPTPHIYPREEDNNVCGRGPCASVHGPEYTYSKIPQ